MTKESSIFHNLPQIKAVNLGNVAFLGSAFYWRILHSFNAISRAHFCSCFVFILYRMKKDIGPDYSMALNFGGGSAGSAKGFRVSWEQGRCHSDMPMDGTEGMERSPLNPHYSFFGGL